MRERRVAIDVTFDVRTDAGSGDPDSTSATLRRYHQLLWNKELPVGGPFDLVTTSTRTYLHHSSGLGEFFPTSDTVIPGFFRYKRMAHIVDQLSQREIDRFLVANHTIGAMMIFPGDRRPGVVTINGARGFNPKIADRFDFTVEAIRRYYQGLPSPLSSTIAAYDDFFRLFNRLSWLCRFLSLAGLGLEERRIGADLDSLRGLWRYASAPA